VTPGASLVLVVFLAIVAACGDDAAGEPEPTGAALDWVNPARCLLPCGRDPSPQLLPVDDLAEPAGDGRHRVLIQIQPSLRDLVRAARAAGHPLALLSAFRSYQEQADLFATTKEVGKAARPGHSEHQLGMAIDVELPSDAAAVWLAGHALDFGFALSYPIGRQKITGYRPEPWHIRFVGPPLADELRASGSTIEELFRARPALAESGDCSDCPLPASHAPCGLVTSAGSCQGTVLTWCYDGTLAAVDCASSAQQCGPSPLSGEPDCL
jgi:D-alanyl-D-alanine carboxypeptidase